MKKVFTLFTVALIIIGLSGCISKRADTTPKEALNLTEENSKRLLDSKNIFSLLIPNDYEMVLDMEDSGARLFKVNQKDTDPAVSKMYIEENPTSMEDAINMFAQEKSVSLLSSVDMTIAGFPAKKISVKISYAPDEIDYYFIRANQLTYVFSPASGLYWEYFQPVVESFRLAQ